MGLGWIIWLSLVGLVGLVWLSRHWEISKALRTEPMLSSRSHPGPLASAPRISVLVAAKDEEENIAECVRSFLAQDYPDLEVIIINDRSRDRTGPILRELAGEHPDRLRVVTIVELREGWFGKNNAMREGVAASTGEWLCFADADCAQTSRRTLSVAMAECQQRGTDFLSILPVLITRNFWERIIQPVCAAIMMLWFRPAKVNNPRSRAAYANGAFMLMKRGVYDALGGHETVRTEVNEDMHLARLTKERGFRLQVIQNDDLYTTRMYSSFAAAWKGWSRIFYGCLGSFRRLFVALLVLTVFSILPWLSLLVAAVAWLIDATSGGVNSVWPLLTAISAAAVALEQSVMARFYRLVRMPVAYSCAYLLGALITWGILVKATLKLGGATTTTWRGTTYRADKLEPTRNEGISANPAAVSHPSSPS